MAQVKAVLVAVIWSAVASSILFFVIKYTVGLRSSVESEEEGLDISEFGERAYHS
jgi:Amt family ammonium transporter